MATALQNRPTPDVSIRPMQQKDLVEARRIFRVAFAAFVGAPDPENFWADRDFVFPRWHRDPSSALVAELDGKLVGSNFATNWGSFGFFGPLTILPQLWDRGIAQKLLRPTMDLFAKWGVREAGLFTFPHSAKHVGLYQKFGFWPRFLTAVLSKNAQRRDIAMIRFSSLDEAKQREALAACRKLTDSIYEGLDVTSEIELLKSQKSGETVLLWSGTSLDGFAVCPCGEGTEAGRDTCYVKFAAAAPGVNVAKNFDRLLDACESLAAEKGQSKVQAGVNVSRSNAYRQMLARGFRADFLGVAMHRPDSPAYNRPEVFVTDDWR